MVSKALVSALITALILLGTVMPADGVSPPRISSPAEGSVLLANTVDVTGTSEPTNVSWTQTTQADFDGGDKDNVTVLPSGEIRMNTGTGQDRYDDFNDNSLDSKLWARTENYGLGVSETGSELKLSGTSQVDGWKMCGVMSTRTVFGNFSADLTAFSGTGTGYASWIYFYQDSNNRILFGVDHDVGWAGNQDILWVASCISGSVLDTNLGAISEGPHRFQVAYATGTVYCFLDGALKATKTVTMKSITSGLYARARNAGDSVDARWDNVTLDPVLRTYDDFEDNSFDGARWAKSEIGGLGASETTGMLELSGTSNTGGYWTSWVVASSIMSANTTFADLRALSASASGYASTIGLYQDASNHVEIGAMYDPGKGSGIFYYFGALIEGVSQDLNVGNAGNGVHRYGLVFGGGTVRAYADGALLKVISMPLTNPTPRLSAYLLANGDSMTARWDNVTVERNRTVYDDFDDNSFDAGRWTKDEVSGLGVSETGGALRFSGTSTTTTPWECHSTAYSINKTNAFFGDITSISASSVGWGTGIGLFQDANNFIYFHVAHDPAWSKMGLAINVKRNGVFSQQTWDVLDDEHHRLGGIYENGFARVYLDNVLFTVTPASLTDPVGYIQSGIFYNGETATFNWDNISTGWDSGTLLPSGNFTSAINDMRCPAPLLKKISWNADVPSGSAMTVLLRSSDNPDMSSPTAWVPLVNNQTAGLPMAKRYIQYKAAMSRTLGDAAPVLRDVVIEYQRPVSKVELSIDGQATWITAAGTAAWRAQLALPDGKTTIWVRATDGAGDAALSSVTVTVDTLAPAGTVLINNGAEYAGDQNVTLGLNATDQSSVSSVMLGEDPELIDASWTSYRGSMPFQLSPGDGPKTVYARFRDVNGWESEIVSDSVVLDTQAPVGSVVVNGGAEFTAYPNVTLTFTASDLSGVGQMLVSNLADLSGAQWMLFAPRLNWTLLPGNGERTVYVKLRDAVAHDTGILSSSILLDTIAPVLNLTIDSGAAYTRYRNATITLTGNDNYRVDAMVISQSPDFSGSAWEPFQISSAIDLAEGDGLKTVFGKARDAAGNEGPVVSDSTILDTNPPAANILNLPKEVDTPNFTVNWSGTDVVSGLATYDIQYRDGTGAWTDWLLNTIQTSATFKGLANHNYSFRARARDKAGNVGSYPDSPDNSVYVWPKHIPVVTIIAPKAASLATGTLRIFGTAYQPDPRRTVARVELRIDDGEWQMADGTLAWSFRLDTKKLGDGTHTLTVRAFDSERYSNETGVTFRVNNLESSTTLEGMPLLLLVLLIVVVALAGAYFAAKRRRPAPAEKPPLPPEAVSPPLARPPQAPPVTPPAAPPVAPPPMPASQLAVVGKVSVSDLDEEEAGASGGLQKAPPPEPAPEDRPAPRAGGRLPEEPPAPRRRDETSMRESKILKSLSSLPRGLPSSLWGIELDDLASKVVSGERKDSPDGDMLVRINNRWYHGDETNLGLFMQEYKK